MNIQSAIIKRLEWENFLITKGKALDVGVGFGKETLALAHMGFEVDAVDISLKYLELLKDKINGLRVNLINKDIVDVEIQENTYQVIIINNILPFIADKQEVKKIIDKVTKGLVKGGCFVLKHFWSKK